MNDLIVAKDLTLPIDVTTMTSFIAGVRGSGKTNTAVVLVEEALKHNQRSAILDPLDVWWGLKSSADGKKPGFDVVVFGGAHQDFPLEHDQGRLLARMMVENSITGIFSLRHLRKHRQVRFAAEFLEELYFLKGEDQYRERLFVAIDEASTFAPQTIGKASASDDGEASYAARCLGAVEDIIRRGRNAGFGVCLIDQRAASVNKNALSQAELLILHRLVGPQDRNALKDYTEAHDEGGLSTVLLKTIASLGMTDETKGEAWVWSSYLDLFKRTQIRMRETFDSSKTPKFGEPASVPTATAKVDLEALRLLLEQSIENAAANDPKAIQAQIKDLKAQLAAKPAADPEEIGRHVRRIDALESLIAGALPELEELVRYATTLRARFTFGDAIVEESYKSTDESLPSAREKLRAFQETKLDTKGTIRVRQEDMPKQGPEKTTPPPNNEGISLKGDDAMRQRILDVIREFETLTIDAPSRDMIAAFIPIAPTTKKFTYALSGLKKDAKIESRQTGTLSLTDLGRAESAAPQSAPSLDAFHQRLKEWLGGRNSHIPKILETLIEHFPVQVKREDLATFVGLAPTTKAFTYGLSDLRELGFIAVAGPGSVVATEKLFPAGLK